MKREIPGEAIPTMQVYVPRDTPKTGNDQMETPGTSWFDTVIATAGPGYAFTPAQLHTIAGEWETLAERYERARLRAQALIDAEGPGAEYASINNAEKVRESGRALSKALEERVAYCTTMAEKFTAALGAYSMAEDAAGERMRATGGSM
ncbi:hypothetical protein [Prauserella muralis]|uniref:Uncharacterized protein n=1 Tax=Prauserella muralis TaxID=588067 RepID=A0A2V4B9M7_9PSEU|nr:hypothetical protein [Prauserella muralis]PXY32064.1 hypothetical protein BAY60_07075 [Prauserella muralis]TWE13487.1 hypothetical protein FHX69_5610 [Prauserella muralis]